MLAGALRFGAAGYLQWILRSASASRPFANFLSVLSCIFLLSQLLVLLNGKNNGLPWRGSVRVGRGVAAGGWSSAVSRTRGRGRKGGAAARRKWEYSELGRI